MIIEYKNNKLEGVCTNASKAEKKYGIDMAIKISQRIDEISAVDSIETMLNHKIGRCHMLKGSRKGEYAVDLVQPFRFVFEEKNKEIKVVRIIDITDYH